MKVFVDIETTGLDYWSNSIIEFAAIITDDKTRVIDEFYKKAKPDGDKWSKDAERIHGISRESLRDCISQRELASSFYSSCLDIKNDILACDKRVEFIDHSNGRFDYRFVKCLFAKSDIYYDFFKIFNDDLYDSIIRLARRSGNNYPNYKLSTLCDYHGIHLEHHKAASDCAAAMELYRIYKMELLT